MWIKAVMTYIIFFGVSSINVHIYFAKTLSENMLARSKFTPV